MEKVGLVPSKVIHHRDTEVLWSCRSLASLVITTLWEWR
jgi:hypothetical protein